MTTIDDVRSVASALPRSYEVVVRGRVKFRVGRIVYLAFSRDETLLGFAFPKEWREALVETEPHKFMLPRPSDLRFNWAVVRLAELDRAELRDLVVDAWAMVVPQSVSAPYAEAAPAEAGAARRQSADRRRSRSQSTTITDAQIPPT